MNAKDLRWIICFTSACFLFLALGYMTGKSSTDSWYKKHPIQVHDVKLVHDPKPVRMLMMWSEDKPSSPWKPVRLDTEGLEKISCQHLTADPMREDQNAYIGYGCVYTTPDRSTTYTLFSTAWVPTREQLRQALEEAVR